jgi:hypothetical protein
MRRDENVFNARIISGNPCIVIVVGIVVVIVVGIVVVIVVGIVAVIVVGIVVVIVVGIVVGNGFKPFLTGTGCHRSFPTTPFPTTPFPTTIHTIQWKWSGMIIYSSNWILE